MHALRDESGAVYVEFLIAIVPVFLLFFAICQVVMLSTAALVVQHAANRAVRAAIVVLEDDPVHYDGAPRGNLYLGQSYDGPDQLAVLEAVGLDGAAAAGRRSLTEVVGATLGDAPDPQRGARMLPIRLAAYGALSLLAPARDGSGDDLRGALSARRLGASLRYNRAASAVSVVGAPGSRVRPASVPSDANARVTVRVTYLYTCAIPVVRRLMCRGLDVHRPSDPAPPRSFFDFVFASRSAGSDPLAHAEHPHDLESIVEPGARFALITAEATLPNQTAAYTREEAP